MTAGAESRETHHEPHSANRMSRARSLAHGGPARSAVKKRTFKIMLSIRSAISEFIETKVFNKISLDLSSEERTRSSNPSLEIISAILWKSHVFRKFNISSPSPGRFQTGGTRTQQGGLVGTMFHLTRFDRVQKNNFGKLH